MTDRQKLILKYIVEDYIETNEPIGSKTLLSKPYINEFSSATIRAEMQHLEEMGYLEKTHTSSGRIPSELGYRYYVNNLITRDSDVAGMFPLIDKIFEDKTRNREDAIKEATKLLSEMTNLISFTLGANINRSHLKKLDLVPLSETEAILIIVTSQGHVENRRITIPDDMDMEELRKVIVTINDLTSDHLLLEISDILNSEKAKDYIAKIMERHEDILETLINAVQNIADNQHFYSSGTNNMLDFPEFQNAESIRSIIEMFEENKMATVVPDGEGLSIKIGKDNQIANFGNCTVISIPYLVEDNEYGTIAVVGPTRMEYRKVIPLVEYMASNMTKLYRKKKK